ncbi:MAG: NUDIX domain-containing protein [Rhodovarius sp.]|nr:NUDIX domain-containing protein [Rhodovarius sp.]
METRPPKAPPVPPWPGLEVREDRIAWAGRFPLQVVRFTYRRSDGRQSRELTWELWRRGAAVAVLPYDPWSDRVALIEQFRLPALAAGLPPVMTECVAGLLEAGEAPEAAARRECEEEAGLRPDLLESMGRYMLMQGGSDETVDIFCARARIPPESGGRFGLAEEEEDIRLLSLPAEDALAMLDSGAIRNAVAAIALSWLGRHRPRLIEAWRR